MHCVIRVPTSQASRLPCAASRSRRAGCAGRDRTTGTREKSRHRADRACTPTRRGMPVSGYRRSRAIYRVGVQAMGTREKSRHRADRGRADADRTPARSTRAALPAALCSRGPLRESSRSAAQREREQPLSRSASRPLQRTPRGSLQRAALHPGRIQAPPAARTSMPPGRHTIGGQGSIGEMQEPVPRLCTQAALHRLSFRPGREAAQSPHCTLRPARQAGAAQRGTAQGRFCVARDTQHKRRREARPRVATRRVRDVQVARRRDPASDQ